MDVQQFGDALGEWRALGPYDRAAVRRPAVPGSEGWQYRYAAGCANCGNPIVGEFTGILACGESISWRHRDGFAFGCAGRVDRAAPQAIPADEADARCTVHGHVTRWHACEAGGSVSPLAMAS